jgi:N-methylhydantoinase A
VTDAHIALGRLDAAELSGGVTLNRRAAVAAIDALAKKLRATTARTAEAIIAIADASVARALRRVSVERGVDPRACVLVAFGGGGPLHGCALADALGMTKILVPPHAGVLSALGLAIAPARREAAQSVLQRARDLTRARVRELHDSLAAAARGDMRGARIVAHARVRYVGQGYELDVAFSAKDDGHAIAKRFLAAHEQRYGFLLDRPIEVVAARAAAIGKAIPVRLTSRVPRPKPLKGPCVATLSDATLVVASGWTAKPLAIGGWLLVRQ